jgi:hypothetical protein
MTTLDLKELKETTKDLPDLYRAILAICAGSAEEMLALLESSQKENLLVDLDPEKRTEIITGYTNILDAFIEEEMYEDCAAVKQVLEILEK